VAVLNAFFRVVLFLFAASAIAGCGPVWYTAEIISASSIVAEAEGADAAEHSPYEYWMAVEYRDKAQEEAGGGSYEDAIHYAQEAHQYATTARDHSRERMREDLHHASSSHVATSVSGTDLSRTPATTTSSSGH